MKRLVGAGCNRIILACNTSHLFLPKIFDKTPELEDRVVNIINICVDMIVNDKVESIYLLGSEGTIESGIYQDALKNRGVKCLCPKPEEYSLLRDCIEAVKQKKYSEDIKETFLTLVDCYDACILGCTELPILYEMYKSEIKCKKYMIRYC